MASQEKPWPVAYDQRGSQSVKRTKRRVRGYWYRYVSKKCRVIYFNVEILLLYRTTLVGR